MQMNQFKTTSLEMIRTGISEARHFRPGGTVISRLVETVARPSAKEEDAIFVRVNSKALCGGRLIN